jgi:hypothetical protein
MIDSGEVQLEAEEAEFLEFVIDHTVRAPTSAADTPEAMLALAGATAKLPANWELRSL